MNRIYILWLFIGVSIITMNACKQKRKKPTNAEVMAYQQHLVGINHLVVKYFADSIRNVNEKKHWGLCQSRTGLWYKIYHVGKGDSARLNKVATITFQVRLFDGRLCYSTDTIGPKNIIIGRSGMESGLEEGLQYMRVGDSAMFVLPPHLAHGLIGDQKKIPRMAIISYKIILQGLQSQTEE